MDNNCSNCEMMMDDDGVVDVGSGVVDVGSGVDATIMLGTLPCCKRRMNLLQIFKKGNQFGLLLLVLDVVVLDGVRLVYHNR